MTMARAVRSVRAVLAPHIRSYGDSSQLGELGKGAGKGGGGGGSIREAGGAFGTRQAALEERYFREKERDQIENLQKHHQEEIHHHEKEIQRLQDEVKRHKGKIKKLRQSDDSDD
ncbi:ATPase inhibitor, mitochondrial [Amblyraja radiata]|uniref:ATPase inhibitor, mitochondrial n=1 Tax=Amblyraja radiata TaxID=386614 RepID=UPI001401F056|nr:ATPase inhibitor, mitochondrial [Amblyraja radiata]